jgi:hypothetical protein
MNCKQAYHLIHAELDGELADVQQSALDEHVDTCEPCRLLRTQFLAMKAGFEWLADQSQTPSQDTPTEPVIIPLPWVRRAAGFAVAAAAVGALYLAWPFGAAPQDDQFASITSNEPKLEFELTGESFDKYLAVERHTEEPRVHLVWLYKNQGYSKDSSSLETPQDPIAFVRS